MKETFYACNRLTAYIHRGNSERWPCREEELKTSRYHNEQIFVFIIQKCSINLEMQRIDCVVAKVTTDRRDENPQVYELELFPGFPYDL